MRELAATGYLHNRARMVVASFLAKDLFLDWRLGETHFMRHLVDGDLANNDGGWQWAASVGTDAQPYFRIFNPVTQSKKFDPEGAWIRRWVPELRRVPDRYLHEPWTMPPAVQQAFGCVIGRDYPAPIVDHAAARQRAIAAFEAARQAADRASTKAGR
jgi:deoxyribodipyrimidine photo-lyase